MQVVTNSTYTEKKKYFEEVFKQYFPQLCLFAKKYVSDLDTSKEIVHKVFINMWNKKDTIDFEKSMKSYLFTSVHNSCLNYIRDNKKFSSEELDPELVDNENYEAETTQIEQDDLEQKIIEALNKLPEKCRQVFTLNRFEGLKYAEVAGKLNISVKTVESQMSKALKILREELKDYVTIFAIWFLLNG